MQRAHARGPVVAEEAVQDAWEVEARDDEAAEVGDEGEGGAGGGGRGGSSGAGARGEGVAGGVALEGEVDVEEGGDGLDRGGMLGVVEEVALAGLVFGVPVEDVELGVVGAVGGWVGGGGGGWVGEGAEGGVGELLLRVRGGGGGRGVGEVR